MRYPVRLLLFALLAVLPACGPMKTISTPPQTAPVAPAPAPVQDQSLSGQAERAWAANNMAESERLYGILARSAETPKTALPSIFERYTLAALGNRHAQAALDGLDQLRRLNPDVTATGEWQRKLGQALMLLPASEALRRASGAAGEASMPPTLRAQSAAVALLTSPPQDKVRWMEALNALYQGADAASRATMERGLYSVLPGIAPAALATLVDFSLPDTDQSFPWSVLLLEQARRETKKLPVVATSSSTPATERISQGPIFADANLRAEVMNNAFTPFSKPSVSTSLGAPAVSPSADVPMASGCVVLALPTTGNYAAVGSRVAKGAEAAKQELSARGVQAQVIILNTEQPDWIDQLAALPPQCAVVGGPLVPDAYAAAKARNVTSQRTLFAFMSSLDGQEEGTVAWRFFSSPEDQVDAMLRMAEAVGVTSFAALYPEEPYGQRMADLFSRTAGGRMVTASGYPPSNPQAWNGITQSLVGGYMKGDVPVSSAKFQGLFMPDSWEKSAALIPFIFFHGEDRLLLMGSALWEQGISRTRLDPSNTALVIFPAGWNSVSPSAAASALMARAQASGDSADSWMGLGYDFVRFALTLNLTGPTPPADVNARIQNAARMNWSIAPFTWTPQGRASQNMFVFNPTPEGGLELTHPDALREKLEQVKARYQRRMGS